MKKIIFFIVLLLAMCGCKSQKHTVQQEDVVVKTDSVSHVDEEISIVDRIIDYGIKVDSVYENFQRVIKIYDTEKEGNPLVMEITETSGSGKVSKEESKHEELSVITDSIHEDVEVQKTDSISTYVEEEKVVDSKPSPWFCFIGVILGAIAFAYVCKLILKL